MRSFYEAFPHSSARLALAPTFSDHVEDVVLDADMLVRIAIPAGARFVLASFDGAFRVKPGTVSTTLTLPAASTGNGSGSELNPGARRIPDLLADGSTVPTHLCLRAPFACKGSLAFYA